MNLISQHALGFLAYTVSQGRLPSGLRVVALVDRLRKVLLRIWAERSPSYPHSSVSDVEKTLSRSRYRIQSSGIHLAESVGLLFRTPSAEAAVNDDGAARYFHPSGENVGPPVAGSR